MSAASCSFGARTVSTPASGTSGFKKCVESTSSIPSSSKTFATAPMSASVFFLGNAKSSFASFQSGRIELKIFVCFTCPAITACFTPSLCSKSIVLLSSPRLTQCNRFTFPSRSGSASSFIAITAISIPWLRAPSSTRNGNRPLPAMSPHPVAFEVAVGMKSSLRNLLDDAALGSLDELNQFDHVGGRGKLLAHFRQRLRSVQLRTQQQTKSALQRLAPLFVETFSLQPDGVDAEALRLSLRDHSRKRRNVLCDDRARPDIRIAAHSAKLMNG